MHVYLMQYDAGETEHVVLVEAPTMTNAVAELMSRGYEPERGFPQPFDESRLTACTWLKNYKGFITRDGVDPKTRAAKIARLALETGGRAVAMLRQVLERLPDSELVTKQLAEVGQAHAEIVEQQRLLDEWAPDA